MTAPLDDRTTAYILETQPIFEDLRQVAAQISGLLVLAATGASSAAPDHPLLIAAEQLFAQAVEGVEQARGTKRARRHRDSLGLACETLAEALTAARLQLAKAQHADLDAVLVPLRASYAHLQDVTRVLPGFRMVAFEQGCCGAVSS